MAKNGAISIDILIKEGKDGLKKLTMDADGLKKAMESVLKVTNETQNRLQSFTASSVGFLAANQAASQLANTLMKRKADTHNSKYVCQLKRRGRDSNSW